VHKVYVGSVWLLAGQSNVVLSLSDMLIGRAEPWHTLAQQQLDTLFRAPLPDVRIFQVGALNPKPVAHARTGVMTPLWRHIAPCPDTCWGGSVRTSRAGVAHWHTQPRHEMSNGGRTAAFMVSNPRKHVYSSCLRPVQVPIYTSSANTSDLPASGIIEPGNQRSRRKGAGSWEPLTGARIGKPLFLLRVADCFFQKNGPDDLRVTYASMGLKPWDGCCICGAAVLVLYKVTLQHRPPACSLHGIKCASRAARHPVMASCCWWRRT
jgi:hypothetical protein